MIVGINDKFLIIRLLNNQFVIIGINDKSLNDTYLSIYNLCFFVFSVLNTIKTMY